MVMLKMCMVTNIHYRETITPLEKWGFSPPEVSKKMAAVTPTPTGLALCVQYLTEMKRPSQRCVFIFVLGYMATALTG